VILQMGIDIAVRAPHQASLADERGGLIWSGHRFRTTATDLNQLWERLPAGSEPAELTIVMEPTRNAWVPLAAWFRRRGAHVVLVSAERSADLRTYYAKHTKSDRLDSVLLARLPMLHPEGLRPKRGLGPGDPLRLATKLHSTLVKRRTTSLARLLGNKTLLRFLAAGYADPHTVRRFGRARLARVPLPTLPRRVRGGPGRPDPRRSTVNPRFVRCPVIVRGSQTPNRRDAARGLVGSGAAIVPTPFSGRPGSTTHAIAHFHPTSRPDPALDRSIQPPAITHIGLAPTRTTEQTHRCGHVLRRA
jgi:Transposase